MSLKWEWKLKPAVGSDRWGKFDKETAAQAATSCALAFQWVKLGFSSPPGVLNFEPSAKKGEGILGAVESPAKTIQAKSWPGADPTNFFKALADDMGLAFTAGSKGKLSDLATSIKALDKGTYGLIYLYAAKGGPGWHALAIDRDKAQKRVFDPFVGQMLSTESKDVADEISKTYSAKFDSFVILGVAQGKVDTTPGDRSQPNFVNQSSGPAWDWDFSQENMIDALTKKRKDVGIFNATRGGKTMQQLYPNGCAGICYAMSYEWTKARLAGKSLTSADFQDPKKFASIAQIQKASSSDQDNYFKGQATKDGLKYAPIAELTLQDVGKKEPARGIFGKLAGDASTEGRRRAEEIAYKVDGLAAGAYIFTFAYKQGDNHYGHAMAILKTDKITGQFFDPNVGQCTVHAGGESVGALIGAVMQWYQKDFLNKEGLCYRFCPIGK